MANVLLNIKLIVSFHLDDDPDEKMMLSII